LKKLLTPLRTVLARALLWRKRSAAPDAAEAVDALAQTMPDVPPPVPAADLPPSETATEAASETLEPRPGRLKQLLARLAFWRRTPAAADEASEAEASPAGPADGTAAEDGEAPPRPPLAKRLLAILLRKTVWMPAAGLLLITLGALGSIAYMRAQHAESNKALHALQAAKLQLEQENRKLRTQPAPAPTPPSKPTAVVPHQAAVDPAFDVASAANPAGGDSSGNDCMISNKDDAGASLKHCIEAFNQAGGQPKRTR
jgi:hypothetical protein